MSAPRTISGWPRNGSTVLPDRATRFGLAVVVRPPALNKKRCRTSTDEKLAVDRRSRTAAHPSSANKRLQGVIMWRRCARITGPLIRFAPKIICRELRRRSLGSSSYGSNHFSTCYLLTFGCETAAGNCEGGSASLPLQRTADPRRVKWRTRTAVQPLSHQGVHSCSTLPFGT